MTFEIGTTAHLEALRDICDEVTRYDDDVTSVKELFNVLVDHAGWARVVDVAEEDAVQRLMMASSEKYFTVRLTRTAGSRSVQCTIRYAGGV